MNESEEVLVVERKVFDELGAFQGVSFDVDKYFTHLLESNSARFMLRSEAEINPNFKQIIPYVVMRHGERVLSYVRGTRAGEKRLVGKGSIGIGGHINPCDNFNGDWVDGYLAAVKREVSEEVVLNSTYKDNIVALINDDSNEVGQVHLGVVHCWHLDVPDVAKREQMITQLSFLTADELIQNRESYETWSQLCIDNIERMTLRGH